MGGQQDRFNPTLWEKMLWPQGDIAVDVPLGFCLVKIVMKRLLESDDRTVTN